MADPVISPPEVAFTSPLEHSRRQLEALLEVSEAIAQQRGEIALFHDLAGRLHSVIEFDFLSLVLHDPVRNVMRLHILEAHIPTEKVAGTESPIEGHPSGWVWQTQQPLIILDVDEETRFPDFMPRLREHNVRSLAILPLTTAQRRLGSMGFGRVVRQQITDTEMQFMQRVASQVAVAVDNALNLETSQAYQSQLARQRDRVQVLLEINNLLITSRELPELFRGIVNTLERFIHHDYTSLALLDSQTGLLRIHSLDFPGKQNIFKPETVVPRDASPAGHAIATGQPVIARGSELNRIAKEVGSRGKAFKLVERDHKLVRFYLPLKPQDPGEPVWSVIRKLTGKIGESLTTDLHDIAKANPELEGIIDRMDFNATTHGQRDIDDDRLSNLIERVSEKRLGLKDVEADIIGRSYEYLIRKFAEGSGQSAGEFYTPTEVGFVIARIMDPEAGMDIYDPCCGSAGLLIKCELVLQEKMNLRSRKTFAPGKLYGQENEPGTWAMANMNMIIHDMEGEIQIGDTFRKPKFRQSNRLQTFDRVVANPMWNQTEFKEKDYDADELDRFPKGAGFPGGKADWGWVQHIFASLKPKGRAAVVLDTGAASRGSGNANTN